jgi:hypothetical protein
MNREAVGAAIARDWVRGVCHYCAIHDEQVDGDRHRWLTAMQNVCDARGCVVQFGADIDRAIALQQRSRKKMSPADVHKLQREERRERRKLYRAKQAQRKGRAA